jgi:succinate-semialdehyde dehydrogenase/glutarate-semialdehyde dehydrogenase
MPVAEAHVPALTLEGRTGLYVDGHWVTPQEHKTFEVRDPSTGQSIATVVDAGPAYALRALDAASQPRTWLANASTGPGEHPRHAYDRPGTGATKSRHDHPRWQVLTEAQAGLWGRGSSAGSPRGRSYRRPPGRPPRKALPARRPSRWVPAISSPLELPLATTRKSRLPWPPDARSSPPADLTPLTATLLVDVLERPARYPGWSTRRQTRARPHQPDAVCRPAAAKPSHWLDDGRPLLLARAAQRVLRCSMELGGNAPSLSRRVPTSTLPLRSAGGQVPKRR